MNGLIHLYTGNGKGKTTAALGLSIRAAGAGMSVVFVQFLKGALSSELQSLAVIPNIRVLRNKKDMGFYKNMTEVQKQEIRQMHDCNLYSALDLVCLKQCDVLVLDEITAAYNYGLVDKEAVERLIISKPEELELVLTGRRACDLFMEYADYMTEMKQCKHPYLKGVHARRGIEN